MLFNNINFTNNINLLTLQVIHYYNINIENINLI